MLGYLSLDIICSSKLTVFLELRSRKTVRFSEQIMSADKYPSIFSRQMKAIVYIYPNTTPICTIPTPPLTLYMKTASSYQTDWKLEEENQTGKFSFLIYCVRSVWFPFTIIDYFRVWPNTHRLRTTGYSLWNIWFYSDVNAVSFNWRTVIDLKF